MLQPVLSALNPPAQVPVLGDCRVYVRTPCKLSTLCQPAASAASEEMRWPATIQDISQGGIRINLKRRFEKGTGLGIVLPGKDGREASTVFVKVLHLKAQENGTWTLGCKFVSDLSEDEVQNALVAESILPSCLLPESDPSRSRYLANVSFHISDLEGAWIHCKIKRLNLAKCWPLTAGSLIDLSGIPLTPTRQTLRIKVTQCTPEGAGWQLQGILLQNPDA